MQKREKTIILFILSLLIVLLVVFFFIWSNQKKDEEVKVKKKSQEELRQERLQDIGYLEKALEENNKNNCENITDLYTKNQCYNSLAQQELKPEICENITNNIKSSCLYSIYFQKSLTEKKVDPCYNLKNEIVAEKCAQRVKDMNFCDTEECYNEYYKENSE